MRNKDTNQMRTENSQYNRLSVINGNQVIRVNASDPTSIINSGRKSLSDSDKSGSDELPAKSPQGGAIQESESGEGLSPVDKITGDTIDIINPIQVRQSSQEPPRKLNPSVINNLKRQKMTEESFVDLLDHSTLKNEQRRQSNIYQGLRQIEKESQEIVTRSRSSHHRGQTTTNVQRGQEVYSSEYMQNKINMSRNDQSYENQLQQQTSARPEPDSAGTRENQYLGYAAESYGEFGQGTVKINALGSVGDTITYNQTGYSNEIGVFTQQEIRTSREGSAERGRASPRNRSRPQTFNQTSQVELQANKSGDQDLNGPDHLNPHRQYTQHSLNRRNDNPNLSDKQQTILKTHYGNSNFSSIIHRDGIGSSLHSGPQSNQTGSRFAQVQRTYSFAPDASPGEPVRDMQCLAQQIQSRDQDYSKVGRNDSGDDLNHSPESKEPGSSRLLESGDLEENQSHQPQQNQPQIKEPRSILKNSRNFENSQTYDSRKSPLNNNRPKSTTSRDRIQHPYGIYNTATAIRTPTAHNFVVSPTGTTHLGASFQGLDSQGTLSHSNTQGNFHGGIGQGNTFQSNTTTAVKDHQASSITLSNSLPPLGKNPVIVEILKQELLSCKRQLKDQQSSNQFLKKEKFKVEHEKNLLHIQVKEQHQRIILVEQENHTMAEQLEVISQRKNGEHDKDSSYMKQLHKMNELQQKENIILKENNEKNQKALQKEVETLKKHLYEKNKKNTRDHEKMVSQIMQLGSATEHLKDIMRLSQVGKNEKQNQEAAQKIANYIELNFDTTLRHLARMVQTDKNKISHSSLDNTQSLETLYDSSKLEVRAQNFKKFRESTKILIQQLCEGQVQSKKIVIHNLENQLISIQNEFSTQSNVNQHEIGGLQMKLSNTLKDFQQLQKELDRVKSDTVPQVVHLKEELQSQERTIKKELQKQFLDKEEQMQDQLIKQKYQIKEQHEKSKMMKNENTELKIQIESMRFQIGTLQKEQNQRVGQVMIEEQHSKLNQRSKSSFESRNKSMEDGALMAACNKTSKGFLLEKYKNQKLKQEKEKQSYYHVKEKQILLKQIEEYKDTVGTQAALIQELQKKMQSQTQMQMIRQSSNLPQCKQNLQTQSHNNFKSRTTQPSAKDLMGSISNNQKQYYQSQDQFMQIDDQKSFVQDPSQQFQTYQEGKENRQFQANQMTNNLQYQQYYQNQNQQCQDQYYEDGEEEEEEEIERLEQEQYQTDLPFDDQNGSSFNQITESQQPLGHWQQQQQIQLVNNQNYQQPLQSNYGSGQPQRISQQMLASIAEKQSERPQKVSLRHGLPPNGQKTSQSQMQYIDMKTQSKTGSETELSSVQQREPETNRGYEVQLAQDQVNSTLYNLMRSRKQREINQRQQQDQEFEVQNLYEGDESEELTSGVSSRPILRALDENSKVKLNFQNNYMNIENLRAEQFQSLDSEITDLNAIATGTQSKKIISNFKAQEQERNPNQLTQFELIMRNQSSNLDGKSDVDQTAHVETLSAINEGPVRDIHDESKIEGNNLTICDTNSQDSYNRDTIPLQSPDGQIGSQEIAQE